MPRRKTQPKFRFWPGGPRAFPGDVSWYGKSRFGYGGLGYITGCAVVRGGGFEIPEDTYFYADPDVSQDSSSPWQIGYQSTIGRNLTALLPVEVDE